MNNAQHPYNVKDIVRRNGLTIGWLAGTAWGLACGYLNGYLHTRLPHESAQPGYVTPSKIEIVMEDLDKDGQKETLFEYEGKKYLLLYDETTGPKIAPYELKPVQLVVQP